MLWGFFAGGRAGKASPPKALPLPGAVLAGLEVGAEEGLDDGVEVGATQGTVITRPVGWELKDEGAGRPGNGFADDGKPDAVPQDLVCETELRDDWAVEFLSFRTRVDFGAAVIGFAAAEEEEDEVVTAQFPGNLSLEIAGPGKDG